MNIVVICEGATERAFRSALVEFLRRRREEVRPMANPVGISFIKQDGAVPSGEKLKRLVDNSLLDDDTAAVVILKDMYPEFPRMTTEAAKVRILEDIGNTQRVYAHVARYDFEAWLLPYWDVIIRRVNSRHKPFGKHPEDINDDNPPAHRLKELYRIAKPRPRNYSKPIEACAILRGKDLSIAAEQCRELKLFLNTILRLSQLPELP